jgi:hypothetical protein
MSTTDGQNSDSMWVPIEEFSRIFQYTKKTLSRYINAGKIRSYRTDEKTDRYYLHMARAYKELCEIAPQRMQIVKEDESAKDRPKKSSAAGRKKAEAGDSETTNVKVETLRIKNELLKMELEQKRELLVERSAVEMIETKYLSNFKALMRQAPAQWSRQTGIEEKVHEQLVNDLINQLESLLDTKKKMYAEILQTPLSFNPF